MHRGESSFEESLMISTLGQSGVKEAWKWKIVETSIFVLHVWGCVCKIVQVLKQTG
jgi:hypothetical protein